MIPRLIKVWFKPGREDKKNKVRLKQTNKIVEMVENLRLKNSAKEIHDKISIKYIK